VTDERQVELLAAIRANLADLRTDLLTTFRTELAPINTRLDGVQAELAELGPIKARLDGVQAELGPIKARLDGVQAELGPIKARLDGVQAELGPIKARLDGMQAELGPIKVRLDGMPVLHRHLMTTQQDIRMLTAAFNDFARENATKGEMEALHADLNRVQAEYATLAVRMETAERQIRDLQDARERN
jgi:chromosome segregation ATPase